jgi:hypothetical protein
MNETLGCPRRDPDTGNRCNIPLPPGARYGPCPACVADIARRHADALFRRNCKVAEALAAGYEINEADEFHLPKDDQPEEEVIAGDRAGAPSRRAGSTGPLPPAGTDTSRARALRSANPPRNGARSR